ncbi:MAG: HAD-IA family hydrolase [Deltaproteobacteria bacterium]|nr:HAD-IA family hydrolase [Deltaproteobacteria bacterium]
MEHIRSNLLLDLGGVLVGADHAKAVQAFCALTNNTTQAVKSAIYESGLSGRLELGELNASRFRAAVCRRLGANLTSKQFDEAWCAALFELDQTEALLKRFANERDLYMLSNTNSIHFEAVCSLFPSWIGLFKGFHLSYEVGLAKPSPTYFEAALARFALVKEACVFLDDSPENVHSAEATGIRAYRVGPAGLVVDDLREWGLA